MKSKEVKKLDKRWSKCDQVLYIISIDLVTLRCDAVDRPTVKGCRQDSISFYTAQNKFVCTRLFAFFDVLNWSVNKKVYTILKLVQFPIQL